MAVPSLVLLYLLAWAASPLVMHGTQTDLEIFFWPAAQIAAHGHPLSVYSSLTVGGYPDANGPLSLLLLAPLAALTDALGWSDPRVAAGMVGLVAGVLALLIARDAMRLVELARGGVSWRLAAYATFLLTPALWVSVAGFGHIEQLLELFFVLRAARLVLHGRFVAAGTLYGLALLARTAALTLALPLLLAAGAMRRRAPATVLMTCAGCGLAGLLPFVLTDPSGLVHSLVTFRGSLPIAGGSLWVTLYRNPLAPLVEHADAYVALATVAVICFWLVRRRPDAAARPSGLLGLLCIGAACFPALAKTVHSYYLLEPCLLGTAWWLARPGSMLNWRIAVPGLLTLATFLTEWSAGLTLTGLGAVEGVICSLVVACAIALVALDVIRGSEARPDSAREAVLAARSDSH